MRAECAQRREIDIILNKVWQWSVNQVERGKLNLRSDQLTLDGTVLQVVLSKAKVTFTYLKLTGIVYEL